jgi:phosphoribosylformimino-5-aminoimidazole carboxamide ribonucleotide (ProFAR) isomerase
MKAACLSTNYERGGLRQLHPAFLSSLLHLPPPSSSHYSRTCANHSNPPAYYAELYKKNGLTGGHVIKLGPGNDEAAREAVGTWKNGLQIGGGITPANAQEWLDAGAEKVGLAHMRQL